FLCISTDANIYLVISFSSYSMLRHLLLSMYLFYIKKRRCHHFFIIVNIILSVSMQNDNLPFKITACVYKIV
ncbi:hypothetical protein B8A11_15140, partial [Staphylococcus aureus]